MNGILRRFSIGAGMVLGLSTAAIAQWSIGQPGTREPPPGQNRYVYLVMADPLPGREADFNDGYQNMHMGDLVQLSGCRASSGAKGREIGPRSRSSRACRIGVSSVNVAPRRQRTQHFDVAKHLDDLQPAFARTISLRSHDQGGGN